MTRRIRHGMGLPLFAWGEQLRVQKQKRRTRRRRIAFAGVGILIIGLTSAFPPAPRLVWNASASAPIGLYAVAPGANIDPGDMVVAQAPARWRMMAAQRRYLPANVPLVKRVAAVAGDEICALGAHIYRNGKWLAERRVTDAKGRIMPWWSGCIRLRGRQIFLLMPNSSASFDGRYFGVTEGSLVIGKTRLLWAR